MPELQLLETLRKHPILAGLAVAGVSAAVALRIMAGWDKPATLEQTRIQEVVSRRADSRTRLVQAAEQSELQALSNLAAAAIQEDTLTRACVPAVCGRGCLHRPCRGAASLTPACLLAAVSPSQKSSPAARERACQWLCKSLLGYFTMHRSGAVVLASGPPSQPTALVAAMPPGVPFQDVDWLWRGGIAFVWRYSGWARRVRLLSVQRSIYARMAHVARGQPFWRVWLLAAAPRAAEQQDSDEELASVVAATETIAPICQVAEEDGVQVLACAASYWTRHLLAQAGFAVVEDLSLFGSTVSIMAKAP